MKTIFYKLITRLAEKSCSARATDGFAYATG